MGGTEVARFDIARFRRDGGRMRRVGAEEVRAFCARVCEEDLVELEQAFGVAREALAELNLDDRSGLTLGFWVLSFFGEDCVLLGIRRDAEAPGAVWIWTQTSDALARHKLSYVRWARDTLALAIRLTAPWAEEAWAVLWERHRVRGMARRVMAGERVCMVEGTELGVYRLCAVGDDLKRMKEMDDGNRD